MPGTYLNALYLLNTSAVLRELLLYLSLSLYRCGNCPAELRNRSKLRHLVSCEAGFQMWALLLPELHPYPITQSFRPLCYYLYAQHRINSATTWNNNHSRIFLQTRKRPSIRISRGTDEFENCLIPSLPALNYLTGKTLLLFKSLT